ncbi:F-box DNA helicase 1 isoform X2 [Echeneis naucrates]|nr:F-box DNA helicase 1 isoform X2 [Echeneis naucrates]
MDPNRWLYPTKRQKRAAPRASGSQPEEEDVVEPELQFPHPGEEEDEIDDATLLAAETLSWPVAGEVDHLEGMTAEMFGQEFECFEDSFDKEDELVEALPDAHYGLLGSSKTLLQPQGCMEDLPDEVLLQILSLLPAQDLYRSVSRVCHRWRNIVEDSKFLPFKKQYYRYMMREKDAVQEIFSVLMSSIILHPNATLLSQYSIRQLVVLMAQHKVAERVWPENVLKCVEKHRLFPQAEASIRLRIPDIPKHLNPGTEGTNPYAVMAVILILSESVGDVQALVSLLTKCMSHTAITEYLCHIAMLLVALKRSNIQISSKLHYNIYYVLHLMENGPFSLSSYQGRGPQIQLTGEQQQILSHNIRRDHVVKIIAFAGTGKTTTLVKYAEQRPDLRFLYVAFNKSVASEAARCFPRNVDCKTAHSLAFKDIGKRYCLHRKITPNLNPFTINSVLPEGRGGFVRAKIVSRTLNAFLASVDETITTRHVPSTHVTKTGHKKEIDASEKLLFVNDAKTIWEKMKSLNGRKTNGYFMTHDGYLKLWQLQNPKPRLSDQYDVIFIDEAQDCTPAIMDVLLSQQCGKILVGDPHQQIYTFKGAVNALQVVDHTHIYYLTQSFRFGAEIAYVAASILSVCKRVQKILVGGKQKGSVCDQEAAKILEAVRTGVSPCQGKMAILSRCNINVFSTAVKLIDANPQCHIHFIGSVQNIGLNRIQDIWLLKQNTGQETISDISDPLIRCFARRSWNSELNGFLALKTYVTQTEDLELLAKLSIVEKYGNRIPELVTRLKDSAENDLRKADFIVGTVHKSKGLEFDAVMVSDDFTEVPCSRHNVHHHPTFSFDNIPDDEWNLLYVAVTRARTSLIIPKSIHRILTMAGEYHLKSAMPDSLMKAGELLPCSITNCPNCITPGSAFIMCRQKMEYTDGVSSGGPLCERCVWTRIGPTAFLMTEDVLSMAEIREGFAPPDHHAF